MMKIDSNSARYGDFSEKRYSGNESSIKESSAYVDKGSKNATQCDKTPEKDRTVVTQNEGK